MKESSSDVKGSLAQIFVVLGAAMRLLFAADIHCIPASIMKLETREPSFLAEAAQVQDRSVRLSYR